MVQVSSRNPVAPFGPICAQFPHIEDVGAPKVRSYLADIGSEVKRRLLGTDTGEGLEITSASALSYIANIMLR